MSKKYILVMGAYYLIFFSAIMLIIASCDKDTTVVNEKIGIADKIKEIAHKKDSVIANRDSVIAYLHQIIAMQEDKIKELSKAEIIEETPDKIGEIYKDYTLVVTVTKSNKYDKYPNKVHGEVKLKDKVFHHYTIYASDCSVQKAMYDVRKNLKAWVDR